MEGAERDQIKEPEKAETDFERECRNFSLSGLTASVTEGKPLDGRELEISQELEQRNGPSQKGGIQVPWAVFDLEERADLATDASAGTSQELASRPVMNHLQRFFETSAAARFGIKAIQVSGTPAFPEITGGGTMSWVAEGAGSDATAITTTSQTPTIKTANARYVVTRQAAKQNPAIESILRRDLAEVMREGIDLAAFQGTGANEQPTGLENALTGARAINVSDIASFTELHLRATTLWESAKLSDVSGINFAGAPILRQTLIDSLITGTAVSEYDRFRSAGFSGVWSQQVSAQSARDATGKGASNVYLSATGGHAFMPTWGGVELVIDPYSESKSGKIAITAFAFVDLLFQRLSTHFLKLENVQDRA
ncbi:phage major capsid protein [Pseudophaeobacter flagellatus]|uniref:phage major capsid protein n=1 Tax=Pseudophaeobacter flagellatus TaxID=2899119 RepID=UPI001E5D1D8E|nr:phage major capsid protein [Pseudophaeobacter flagellatus]